MIRLLPPDVAAKIAAGEVVERPANVAKELIENSLDAHASEIRVEIREGGRRLLRVVDNGQGMTADEAPLAFARHATSKLQKAEDLEHIATFGFRGEALYSIAAVSQLTLLTRHKDEEFGLQLRLEGGALLSQQRAGAPVGASITVEHLFFNTPARAKFLRQAASEAGQIAAVIQRYALAYPHVRFSLVNDGKVAFQSNGSGDLFDVLIKIYGLEDAQQMVKLAQLEGSVGISGYVSLPSFTRANRTGIAIFVNRRYIEDRTLVHAVVQGYHTLLPVGRFPVAVVMVELDPSQVDVNVHPQKTQVRFIEERRIFNAVQKTVRQSVIEQAPVPNFVFTASALPGGWQSSAAPPSVEGVDVDFWQPSDQGGAAAYPGAEAVLAAWAERRTVLINAGQSSLDSASSNSASFDLENADRPLLASARQNSAFAEDVEQNHALEQTAVVSASVMPPLLRRTSQLPPLRVVGQIGAMYIVTEGPGGMFLIDQHAAHERILYEKFMTQRHSGLHAPTPVNAQQYLLEPLTLHLGTHLAGLVAQHLDALASVGFVIEVFGGDTFLVRGVPNVLSGEDPLHMLEEIVQALADRRDGRRNLLGETVEAQLVKMVCKRAAIKAGQLLSDLEMQELVRQLEECESPRTCPHGRPTMIQLSAGELEKAFGRI